MIEVTCNETGDTAEAETPEAAMVAARELGKDAYTVSGIAVQGRKLTFSFVVNGEVIASALPERDVWKALAL